MKLGEHDHNLLSFWAADCAERVISHFKQHHSQDNRPRQAIEAGRAWARGETSVREARAAAFAAHAAARNAEHPAARAAARAAGHTAATAHVASHARHAAAYAVTAAITAAVSAASGATSDTDASTAHDWQLQKLAKHLRPIVFPDEAAT